MIRLAVLVALAAGSASAHDGVAHGTAAEAAAHQTAAASGGPKLPFDLDLGGAFTLTDQTGAVRSQSDPQGRAQLVFFGYANCQSICSVALPLMAEAVTMLADEGVAVTPVMITVDPARDRVDTIGAPLAAFHRDFVGLTGTETELAQVYSLFSIDRKIAFEDPEHGAVFAHGSHIYLLDGEGAFLTLLPPILSAERVVEIVHGYIAGGA